MTKTVHGLAVAGLLVAAACGGNPAGNTKAADFFALTPGNAFINGAGDQAQFTVTGDETSGAPIKPADVAISPASGASAFFSVGTPVPASGGVSFPVTGVGVGTSTFLVDPAPGAPVRTGEENTVSATVRVGPAGTWSGSVTLVSTSCQAGGQGAYNETLVIAGAPGSWSATAQDTPGFDRKYAIDFDDSWYGGFIQSSATGSFTYLGIPVGGTIAVLLSSPTTLLYTETTTYPCANTYTGTLTLRR